MKYLLIIIYLSFKGDVYVNIYEQLDKETCNKNRVTMQKQIKAGKATINCYPLNGEWYVNQQVHQKRNDYSGQP